MEVRAVPALRELGTLFRALVLPRATCFVASVWNPEATVLWLARRRDIVVMAHGNEVMRYPSGLRYVVKTWLRKRVLASARSVVCNSRYTEALVRAISSEARTVVINPGVDAARFAVAVDQDRSKARFGISPRRRIVLSVSRMDAYKGHDTVLRALAELPVAVRQQIQYVVAGRGGHLAELQRQARSLGLEDVVIWLGFVADADLPALYACADLFVLCTREDAQMRGVEGFGMVFLEAQAAGVPVIGTKAGGIPDAIDEGNGGWLIDQDDVAALGAHLRRLVHDQTAFREQGERGRHRAKTKGSWTAYVSQLAKVIDDAHA
jgi:phosphatidyl-myo-inositol dimannoside synthase